MRWLPARASATDSDADGYLDAVPMGIGPVDVVPVDMATDIALEREFEDARRDS